MFQPQKMLIPTFSLRNGTLITSMLLLNIKLALICTKLHRFVENTPKKFSTIVFNQLWLQGDRVTRIQFSIQSVRQGTFLRIVPSVIKH